MTNLNTKKIAQKATTLAQIFEGRDKIETEEIIKEYKDIHIDNFEYVFMDDDKQFWAYTFTENKGVFAYAGFVLAKIFNAMLEECNGDYEELYASYKNSAMLHVELKEGRTKAGNKVTTVTVL